MLALRRSGIVGGVLFALLAFFGGPARAYVGSAQISPEIAAARVQLALSDLDEMARSLRTGRGNAEAFALNLGPARMDLAQSAYQLGLARMSTLDPSQHREIDGILADLEDLRERCETSLDTMEAHIARTRVKILWLRAEFRHQFALEETKL